MASAAFLVVLVAGVWMVGLAAFAGIRPTAVRAFLNGFARSATTHFTEVIIRIIVGGAFVFYAPSMRFGFAFATFGWILIATSLVLLVVPWRLHRRFAERSLPIATKRMPLFALASLSVGLLILVSLFAGTGE